MARGRPLSAAAVITAPSGVAAGAPDHVDPATGSGLVPAAASRAFYAAVSLAMACSLDGRLRFLAALPLVFVAFVLCAATMGVARRGDRLVPWRAGGIRAIGAMAGVGAVIGGADGEAWFEVLRRSFAVLAIPLVVLAASDDPLWRRRALWAAVAGSSLISLLAPLGTPNPGIDVVTWTSAAIQALLRGVHPYTVQAADVYGGSRDFGFTVMVYPYMPATLLALAPWSGLCGDFRYGLAVCLPLTVWLVRSAGGRAGTDPRFLDAATLALVLHPIIARVVRSGWTEPLLIVAAAAYARLAVGRRRDGAAAAFFVQPALKQYVVAPVIFFLAMSPVVRRRRAFGVGLLVAALTIGPFLLWNPAATIDGMFFQIRALSRPRLTAVSIPGLFVNLGLAAPPMWASMAAQMVAGAVAFRYLRKRGAGGVLLSSAFSLLATFLIGWQAFVNYYYYIGALLVIAAVLLAAPRRTPV